MNTELATAAPRHQFDLSPQSFDQALTFAGYLAESDLVPKDFKNKPGNCLIAMQWGAELGLKPLQALQNLAIINGRPSLWGDAVLALVLGSPVCEYVVESVEGDTSICRAKRKGAPEQIRTFSDADAKAAGLLGKAGPWVQYKSRMRQMRARAFCLRDVFADVLRGMPIAEEVMDTPPERFMGQAEVVQPPAAWPEDLFASRLPEWHKAIAEGRATVDGVIAKAKTKHPLTDAQCAAIRTPLAGAAAAPAPAASAAPATPPAGPAVSFAEVNDRLLKAQEPDQLDEAADLIESVVDPEQRRELAAVYDARRAAVNA